MIKLPKILALLAVYGMIGFGLVAGAPASAQMAHKERVALMKTVGGGMKNLKQAQDTATMMVAAKAVNGALIKLADDSLWPQGSHGGETRAKIEIWQNMADFKSKLNATEMASALVAKQAASGDLGSAKKAFGELGKTCGTCHKVYRTPKK